MNRRLPAVTLSVLSAAALILLLIARSAESQVPSGEELADSLVGDPVERIDAHSRTVSVAHSPSTGASSAAAGWHVECVDCPKWFGYMTESSLQLDAAGHPHMAYGKDYLYYTWHDGTQWRYETVDDNGLTGDYASLVLDAAGYPHIIYRHCGYYGSSPFDYCSINDLRYTWYDGTEWHREVIDTREVADGGASLKLDSAGRPHVSFGGNGLFYGWRDAMGWHTETVDSTETQFVSLALDDQDLPHISYFDFGGSRSLKYAWNDGVGWHSEIVDVYAGAYTSIALDLAGHPHISYFDEDSRALKYARNDSTGWQVETVDNAGYVGEYTSLALDAAGHPHISYRDVSADGLKYAWHDGSDWHIESVPTGSDGNVGWYTSLALDVEGRPHIIHLDHFDYIDDNYLSQYGDDLLYTWRDETNWHSEILDSEGNVGAFNSLALDQDDRPHIGFYDTRNYDLKYAWYSGSDWRIETVDDAIVSSLCLALDVGGRPHISYRSRDRLKYAWHDGAEWQIEIVDNDISLGGSNSLALDQAGRPHISYAAQDNLKYAWHDGAIWHVETVDGSTQVGEYNSLALDVEGRPHISYFDWEHWDLKYAWHDGVAWHTVLVDGFPDETVGQFTSLALDGESRPHISYRGTSGEDLLKYAWHDGTTWQIETVLTGSGAGNTSLTLDEKGRPHISCFLGNSPTYVWYDGAQWRTRVIERNQYGGMYTSLALDSSGPPNISYYSGALLGDLKYAWLNPPVLSMSKTATPSVGVRNGDTITFSLIFSAAGLNVRVWDPLPTAVQVLSGSISGNVTPSAVYSSTANAIVWQGALTTDTFGVIRFQATPGITGTASLSLALPIVNTAWLTDTVGGHDTSATVIVNGYRTYFPIFLREK